MFFSREEIAKAETIAAALATLPAELDNAFLFGAGAIGQSLLWHFRQRQLRVSGFVDNNEALWGGERCGLPVISLQEFAVRHRDKPLVLALARGFRDVRAQCLALGLTRLVPHYLCRAALGICPFGNRLTARQVEEAPGAAQALDLWEDADSKKKFRQLVRFQILFDDAQLPPAEKDHYFSPAYLPKAYLKSVVDVGACDGDTLRDFLAATTEFEAYYAFEPDPENFRKLSQTAPEGDNRIRLFNLGLDSETRNRHFRGFGSLLSNMGDDGDAEIRVDSLDNILGTSPVTLIKIDVEGHEPHALAGMEETIRRNRPALAISIYHQVDHLWSLPMWLNELNLGYRFRLGCHGDLYSEAVCYALPGELPMERRLV